MDSLGESLFFFLNLSALISHNSLSDHSNKNGSKLHCSNDHDLPHPSSVTFHNGFLAQICEEIPKPTRIYHRGQNVILVLQYNMQTQKL